MPAVLLLVGCAAPSIPTAFQVAGAGQVRLNSIDTIDLGYEKGGSLRASISIKRPTPGFGVRAQLSDVSKVTVKLAKCTGTQTSGPKDVYDGTSGCTVVATKDYTTGLAATMSITFQNLRPGHHYFIAAQAFDSANNNITAVHPFSGAGRVAGSPEVGTTHGWTHSNPEFASYPATGGAITITGDCSPAATAANSQLDVVINL